MLVRTSRFLMVFALFLWSASFRWLMEGGEPHRPYYHFTPPKMWMNDPNGMVYYKGEYHLFYQFYPEKTVWGPMHWGHAVSKDMVHWKHFPIALYPDSLGLIFSGSAVVDWNNSSGLGEKGAPPMIAIFTHHSLEKEREGRKDYQYQSIAFSNDKGRTWSKYPGNPVIPNTEKIQDFRDPKVSWDEASRQWVMVFAAHDRVKLWGSRDLKSWTHLSDFGTENGGHGGVWECPDLFQIPVEGSTEKKWVMLVSINPGGPNGGSATQYFVGDFDGKHFTLDPTFEREVANEKAVWLDWGKDNYAGVTWSDIPKSDGRRLFLGWMSNWEYATLVPTDKWRSAMTLPRELKLKQTEKGFRLLARPAKEVQDLRKKKFVLATQTINKTLDLTRRIPFSPSSMEAILEIETPKGEKAGFFIELGNGIGEKYRIGYDAVQGTYFSDRTHAGKVGFSDKFANKIQFAPLQTTGNTHQLHLFFDRASCELFANDGREVMTNIFFPNQDFSTLKIVTEGGRVELKSGVFYQLKPSMRN